MDDYGMTQEDFATLARRLEPRALAYWRAMSRLEWCTQYQPGDDIGMDPTETRAVIRRTGTMIKRLFPETYSKERLVSHRQTTYTSILFQGIPNPNSEAGMWLVRMRPEVRAFFEAEESSD